ncbi:MAG: DUF4097 family beta strand repeat-containing protein, partial [Pseudonocardia sp.]
RLAFDLQQPRLTVEVGSGQVTLRRAEGDRVEVRRTVRSRGVEPTLDERSTPDGVTLVAQCPWAIGAQCSVDYDVQVPDGVALTVRTDSGGVSITGVTGRDVKVDVDDGEVRLTDVHGAVDVTADSGNVVGERLDVSSFAAETDSGAVTADFTRAPEKVEVVADSGDVELVLPAGPYRVQVEAESGEERIEVPVDSTSPSSVRVDTDSGDVQLRPR